MHRNTKYNLIRSGEIHMDNKLKMITNYKLEKSFGPIGSSAGLFMFVIGIISTYESLFGLVLVLIGAFTGFSSTGTLVDRDKRRLKFSNNLFGIIRTGIWIALEPGMNIGIKNQDQVWKAYSRSNQALEIDSKAFVIMLFDADGNEIMPIAKAATPEKAITGLKELSAQLGIGII